MPIDDRDFLLNQTVELRQVHSVSLKKLLKTLNTLITLYQAKNSFSPTIQAQIDIKINSLNAEIIRLEELNKKIQIRLDRVEKLFVNATKHKIRDKLKTHRENS